MIVIKDMDMPKKCDQVINGEVIRCPLLDDDDSCRGQNEDIRNRVETWDEQMEYCPLQEIGGTNGEVIASLFPDNPIDVFIHDVNIRDGLNVVAHFDREWWDAPYKAKRSGEVNCN